MIQEHLDAMSVSSVPPIHSAGQWGGGYVEMGPRLISNPRAAPDGTA